MSNEAMIAVGVPAHIAAMSAQVLAVFAQGDSDWLSDDVATILGRSAWSFEQFAIDNATAFS